MIVKWEDDLGTSYFDYVVQVGKMNDENKVMMTQCTLDDKLITREFTHGSITVVSDKAAIVQRYGLGARKQSPQ